MSSPTTTPGERQSRALRRFIEQHPWCCFCGGEAPTETRDEVPPKAFFYESVWPEGYQFPACRSCNNSTSAADQVVSILSRTGVANLETAEQKAEGQMQLERFIRHYPQLARDMNHVSPHRIREAIRRGSIKREPGKLLREHPVFHVPDKLSSYIRLFGAKAALAFHYKHTGQIVRKNFLIVTRWYGLAEKIQGEIPNEIFDLPGIPMLARDGHSLNDQLDYRYTLSTDRLSGIYGISFRRTIFVIATISPGVPDGLNPPKDVHIVRPFGRT